ncbi:hypothetical protein UC35_21830 [Ramlibacter tataouinensis]|uniref:Uncharacterized protein n=1 Tax=Ramlibacter tataouinensis TaxID=94132 RepID=A0A127K1H1_9BURK|nr:hypothetical protein UC35_21830 [Ramlibacter tataouinensis]
MSTAIRLAIALAVAAALAAGWVYAEGQSRVAVHASSGAINATYVTLPRVEVVGRRDTSGIAKVAASGAAAL